MAEHIRFGEYEFDRDTGELSRAGAGTPVTRLPPQPARLLCLLVDAFPEAVTREKIRETIWPDSDVEFDRSLHFCVRQVRSALGDSAGSPEFVETIPRRGYRWMKACSPVGSPPAEQPVATAARIPRRHVLSLAVLATLLALTWAGVAAVGGRDGPPQPAKVRVAIMSFESEIAESAGFRRNGIAELLLYELATDKAGYEVIGPSSTTRYELAPLGLRDLAHDYRIDFILNGRFVRRDGRDGILAEVIRARDGAHVWVEYFEDGDNPAAIAGAILAGFRAIAAPT